jgi:hypothetical protein
MHFVKTQYVQAASSDRNMVIPFIDIPFTSIQLTPAFFVAVEHFTPHGGLRHEPLIRQQLNVPPRDDPVSSYARNSTNGRQ